MEDRGQRITTFYLPVHVKSIIWAEEDLDTAQGVFSMNWACFSSEARVRRTSIQCYEHISVHTHHILFSQAFPSPLKTKQQNQKQQQSPIWKSAVTLFKIHTFVNSAYTGLWGIQQILTSRKPERRRWFKIKNTPCIRNTKKIMPHYFVLSLLTKELPQHRSPGPILRHN